VAEEEVRSTCMYLSKAFMSVNQRTHPTRGFAGLRLPISLHMGDFGTLERVDSRITRRRNAFLFTFLVIF
jgi:hypothetical protein